ncbi:MAG: hypothetical protein GY867_10995, partial [bacterium]|nr:hypothetical protein [bacterium]
LTFAAVLVISGSAAAEIGFAGFDAGITTGYSENLLRDSSDLADTYRQANLALKLYPVSMAEISLTGNYTFYDAIPGLSNFVGGGGFTIIPLRESSPLSVYLSGNFSKRSYRLGNAEARNDEYNTTDLDAIVSVGYRLRPNLRIRAAGAYKTTLYEETDYTDSSVTPVSTTSIQHVDDKSEFEFLTGLNWTLPGSNVLDIEAGYMQAGFQRVDPEHTSAVELDRGDTVAYNLLIDGGDLKTWYISPRWSRPLGKRSGFSVTFSHRRLVDQNDSTAVYGYSTGLQSPWVGSYEGNAIQVNVKTYLLEKVVVSAGYGYQDKTYIDVLEMTTARVGPRVFSYLNWLHGWHERSDQIRQARLSLKVPVPTRGGLVVEPSLNFKYTSNSSTVAVYEYSDFTISSGINIRL